MFRFNNKNTRTKSFDATVLPLLLQGGNKEIFGGATVLQRSAITTVINKKQLGICIEYTHISEFMLWLHWGKFVNVK